MAVSPVDIVFSLAMEVAVAVPPVAMLSVQKFP
jgi:hypothetical protein